MGGDYIGIEIKAGDGPVYKLYTITLSHAHTHTYTHSLTHTQLNDMQHVYAY